MHLTISVDASSPGVTSLHLGGELDLATAQQVRRWVRAVGAGTAVRLDLGDVVFLGCVGLAALEDCRDQVERQGGSFELAAASPAVRRILWATGSRLAAPATSDLEGGMRHRSRPSRFVRTVPAVVGALTGARGV